MSEENNIFDSVQKLYQKQFNVNKIIRFLLIAFVFCSIFIFISGFIAACSKYPKPDVVSEDFKEDIYNEGSLKYPNVDNVIVINEAFLDTKIADFLKEQNTSGHVIEKLANHLNLIMNSKVTLIVPISSSFNMPKTDEAFVGMNLRVQKTKDSLNSVLRRRIFLDNNATTLLENTNSSINQITSLKEAIRNFKYISNGDFPSNEYKFTFEIGTLKKVQYIYPDQLSFQLINSAPLLSSSYLLKTGIQKKDIIESDLQAQSESLKQLIKNKKELNDKKTNTIKEQINKQVSAQRARYRKDFYTHWYPTLFYLLNNTVFFLLLLRYLVIIGQKKLPRKSTDLVYFATNRTSRFYRIIAIIFVFLALCRMVLMFFSVLISNDELTHPFMLIPFTTPVFFFLFDPPLTYFLTILITWFFILMSEWIDFISNCYEVMFYKAHDKKNKPDNDELTQ